MRRHLQVFWTLVLVGTMVAAGSLASVAQASSTSPTSLDAATRAKLGQALDAALAKVTAPGVIVGVRVGNRTWTATRGVTDTTTRQPVRLDEFTRVGSITKTFTGTLILQLVDEGKLKLDDTIDRWFPQLADAHNITVRELGDMSSGIDSYTANKAFVSEYFANPTRAWSPEEVIAAGTSLPRKFPPGQGFFYSNTNFVMLGMIIEQVTNQPYPQVLQNRVLRPLGLSATSYPDSAQLPVPHWQGYTTQQSDTGQIADATSWNPSSAAMAGQLVSNLHDMLIWARAVGTGATLSRAAQHARLQGNAASKMGAREYAFAIGTDNGWLAHDGEVPGFNSQLGYYPRQDISIIVLTNSDISTPPTGNGPPPAPVIFAALGAVMTPASAP